MDKLLALRAFIDVAETGGFSKAARRMGVATSSVTRLMDALEKSLGSALLTRTTRHVTLTDAGSAYLEQITRVLSDLDEADGSVSDTGGDAVGPLRVSMPVTFGRLCLGPHIAGFLQQHPRVSLDLVLSDSYLDLATERIDVAVRIGTPANQPNLIVNRLAEHHRYVVASRDYLESNGMPASPDDLRNHQCLRFAYQAAVQRWSFTRAGSTEHVEINGRLSVNNSDVLREAVISGFGIALLPQWLVEEDVMAGRLTRLFEDYSINPLDQTVCVYAAYLPNRRHSRKVHALLEFLRHRITHSGAFSDASS
ncbi:LysR family transcriptional regulator [Burkholderia sp. HI2500]|uniref:LysR family transcriptional regulator n=1 Tax=Burkholderia sp. HI2500 TaxID=2015358 RepID=UPI000B79CD89|nr:LysR family transcriptional regulator [Burkholderia sp. HI2500]OXJ09296.1 LysR family transcriptional regulator [Burkholderia sp. HI2500]